MTIRDNGPGVPAAFHDRIFQLFFRLEQSRSTAGNGLGLSLVSAVAALHGLEITLGNNQPGLTVSLRTA